jgi:hypothetical protein
MNFTLRKCWMHFHLQFDQVNMILSQLERGSGSILPRMHIFAGRNGSLIQILLLEALSLTTGGTFLLRLLLIKSFLTCPCSAGQ